MNRFTPEYLILHDYGGKPSSFNPYHALVTGGQVRYRYPDDPYGQSAPHAFKLNPRSIGLSWGGAVGGTPDAADLEALRREVAAIKAKFPGIKIKSHGEAYAETKGTPYQASRDGRGLEEAAWRRFLDGTGPMPTAPETAAGGAPPVSARGLTAYAGLTPPAAPPVAPNPTPVTPEEAPNMDPMALVASLFGSGAPAAAGATPGLKLPFGMSLGKPDANQPDPLAGADQLAPDPLRRQRAPLDMSALMQLAATKRRGVIG